MSRHSLDGPLSPTAEDAVAMGATRTEKRSAFPASAATTRRPTLADMAKAATEEERRMSLCQAVRLYRKAIAWSALLSTCIVMEGYSDVLVNNFYSLPQFNRKYGAPVPGTDPSRPENWQVPPRWQSGITNGANCGELIGLLLCGWLAERVGYRATAVGSLVLVTAWIAIFFTAQSPGVLVVAEVLCGIPWGLFQALTITYAVEVSPMVLRGYLTTYINACWGIGHLIGVGVVRGLLSRHDEWAYRVPFALQWIWPVPLAVGIYYAPESPWWLVRRGRTDDAKVALRRLTSRRLMRSDASDTTAVPSDMDGDVFVDQTVAMMVHTMALEEQQGHAHGGGGGGSYWACFRGRNRRRTEIVAMAWAIQNLSGDSFSTYSTYFLTQAGLSPSHAFGFTLGQYAFNVVGVAGTWAFLRVGIGRRALYLWGLVGLFTVLAVLGFLGLVPAAHRTQASLAAGSLLVYWALVYQLTVGTVCYSLVAEISSRRLLFKTMALGRALYLIVGIVCSVITPYMVSTTSWNWGDYSSFFWAGTCFLCIVYTYCRVPEPANLSFAEIDVLFNLGISSRKFQSTEVDVFAHATDADMERAYEANEERSRLRRLVEP